MTELSHRRKDCGFEWGKNVGTNFGGMQPIRKIELKNLICPIKQTPQHMLYSKNIKRGLR